MNQPKVKKEYLNKRIGFGKNYDPLFARTQTEINELAIMALESGDRTLLKLFEPLPAIEEIKKINLEKKLAGLREQIKK